MTAKDERSLVITLNWLMFVGILLCGWPLLMMSVGAAYHPNAPTSPYVNSILSIWPITVVSTLFLAFITPTIAKNSTSRKTSKLSAFVYIVLVVFSAVVLLATKPIPAYSLQTIESTSYQVPSEFLTSDHNDEHTLSLHMCLDNLTGKYSNQSKGCHISDVTLSRSRPTESIATLKYLFFFQQNNDFDITPGTDSTQPDKVILHPGAEQYKLSEKDGLTSYSVNTLWSKFDLEASENDHQQNIPIHLQINENNELVRFANCSQFQSGNSQCKHVVSTEQGVLEYETKGSTEFDVRQWEQQEKDILSLIAQWEV